MLHGNVCLFGDFNEIISTQEKYGGRNKLTSDGERFRKFIFEAGLIDLGYKGPAFTWTNKRDVSEAIYQCLVRVLATSQWLQEYPNAYVNHLPLIHSDHCPILLRLKPLPRSNKEFRFEHWWFSQSGFKQAWVDNWTQNPNRCWSERWKEMRYNVRSWAAKFVAPKRKLERIQQQLYQNQMQHTLVRDHAMEARLIAEYEEMQDQQQTYWRQRSRLQWNL